MTNTSGFSTVTALTLGRDCFTSEQDRLNEFAKSLRVPVQTGEIIKGDPGGDGEKGDKGEQGDPGVPGAPAAPLTIKTDIINIANAVAFVVVPNDRRAWVINLFYEGPAVVPPALPADPPVSIYIKHLMYNAPDTKVYLSAATTDDKWRLALTSYV